MREKKLASRHTKQDANNLFHNGQRAASKINFSHDMIKKKAVFLNCFDELLKRRLLKLSNKWNEIRSDRWNEKRSDKIGSIIDSVIIWH